MTPTTKKDDKNMHYALNGNIVVFYLNRHLISEQSRSKHNFAETCLTEANIKLICDTICRKGQGLKFQTQVKILTSFLRKLVSFCKAKHKKPLPTTSDGWQMFILSFLQFYLTDIEHSQASANSRIISWSSAAMVLKFWLDEGIVPGDVYIPNLVRKEKQSPAKPQMMLGQPEVQPTSFHDAPQKLLVNMDFTRTDADYLDAIERDCREKIELLKQNFRQ